MGFLERKKTLNGAQTLLQAIAESPGFSIVGGGESVAMVKLFGLEKKIDFLSTGGGATLTYISGNDLPALTALIEV